MTGGTGQWWSASLGTYVLIASMDYSHLAHSILICDEILLGLRKQYLAQEITANQFGKLTQMMQDRQMMMVVSFEEMRAKMKREGKLIISTAIPPRIEKYIDHYLNELKQVRP